MECLKCRRPSLNIQFMPYNSCKAKGNEVIELQHKKNIQYIYTIQPIYYTFLLQRQPLSLTFICVQPTENTSI